jgi:phage FluMu protein Com
MQCTFHPDTETLLRCSKCEKPICVRCSIQTPVGARCPECANVQKIPTYNLPTTQLSKAIVVAIVVALALGVFFGLFQYLVPFRIVWIYGPATFIGSGWAVGETISRVTNRKRVPALQGLAIGAYALSFIVYIFVSPEFPFIGFYTLVGLAVGGALALNPFR